MFFGSSNLAMFLLLPSNACQPKASSVLNVGGVFVQSLILASSETVDSSLKATLNFWSMQPQVRLLRNYGIGTVSGIQVLC